MIERERVRAETSERLHEASHSVFPDGISPNVRYVDSYPISIDGEGVPLVRDAEGNEYVDFWNNHVASIFGHAHDRVVEAVVSRSACSAGGRNCSNRRAPTTAAAGLATLRCPRRNRLRAHRVADGDGLRGPSRHAGGSHHLRAVTRRTTGGRHS